MHGRHQCMLVGLAVIQRNLHTLVQLVHISVVRHSWLTQFSQSSGAATMVWCKGLQTAAK